ncbi:MAG TPA: hypothetical protein VHL10_03070 [Nitrososphaera sp.]|nr:hypothetical protein [Nitrososphaera sp.]
MPEERVAHLQKALLDIQSELTSFDPDGDDRDYDREQAVEAALKLIDDVLLPEPQSTLTGQALVEIARKLQAENYGYEPTLAWQNMTPKSRELYDAIAVQVNETYIKPLQTLAQDYQRLLMRMPEVSLWAASIANVADWQQQKEQLIQQTLQTLFEVKS